MIELSRLVVCSLGVLVMLGPATTPTHAQGFLQSLFGGGQPVRPRMMPQRRSYYGSRYSPQNQSVPWWQQGHRYQRPRNRHYTAMCVRLCDGYYWPISNRASRNKFYNLAQQCEDSCNGDAKMFYMPSGGDVKRMTDLSGRAYEHIQNAFLYREKLVKSCTCKPMPWSYSAKARHMKYAAVEAEKRMRLKQLKRRQEFVSAEHTDGTEKPGRTIVESLDDGTGSETSEYDGDQVNPDTDSTLATDSVGNDVTKGRSHRVRRGRRPLIRKRRMRRYPVRRYGYRGVEQRRLRPKPGWNSTYGGGRPRKVWRPGRPRPRY